MVEGGRVLVEGLCPFNFPFQFRNIKGRALRAILSFHAIVSSPAALVWGVSCVCGLVYTDTWNCVSLLHSCSDLFAPVLFRDFNTGSGRLPNSKSKSIMQFWKKLLCYWLVRICSAKRVSSFSVFTLNFIFFCNFFSEQWVERWTLCSNRSQKDPVALLSGELR